jgi:hypothetical protein
MTHWFGVLCLLVTAPVWAATTLFDFENEAEVKAWHDEGRSTCVNFPVTRETRWATSGSYSMCFHAPQWKPGMGEWPACETQPAVTDWSGYDRLVLDMTNPTAYEQKLFFFISDSKVPTRSGLLTSNPLPAHSYCQVVVDLAKLAGQGVNPKDIHVMHFFTERPPGDMEVYVDHFVLLQPGEPLPVPGPEFVKALAALQKDQIAALQQAQQDERVRIRQIAAQAPAVAAWAEQLLTESDKQVATFTEQVERGDPAVLKSAELITGLRDGAARLESLVRLRAGFETVRRSVQVQPAGRDDIVVGFATSMEKVLPRAGTPDLRTSKRAAVALARNEKQALQVVVMPVERDAPQVAVRLSDLRGPGGATFAVRNIDAVPVGYVQTKATPPYGSPHTGWWPDPILNFMSKADIAQGDAQSFWVRVRAPKDQTPGTYRGKLEVLLAGKPLYAFDFSVEVYPFTLPDRSPLNMAITFAPMFYVPDGKGGWAGGDYADKSWEKHKLEWGDFLADYYMTYDSLYTRTDLDFAVLSHEHREGRLGTFNLGYYDAMPDKPEEQEAWKKTVRDHIGKNYQQAKALGLLDHAYIYGCDENPEGLFPSVERAAAFLKHEYPGAMVLTTTYDHSFGTNSVLKSMDGFCPLTPSFNAELADRVRATGKQVWWYICCGPGHPFCNMFIEFPAIEGRLLMGAQTAKYRPDGFLYYQISIWNSKPITKGPFTDWDPRSFATYHGDGSWTCLGPDGTPLPTIRLENFRDGVQDYAYAWILDRAIKRVEGNPNRSAQQTQWLARAKAALEVPASLAKSMTEYTHDPAEVYRWRTGMAKAIAEAGADAKVPLTW